MNLQPNAPSPTVVDDHPAVVTSEDLARHLERVRLHRAELRESVAAVDLALEAPIARGGMFRERVRAALARFLRWHHANRRRLIGVEEHFSTVVDLPGGERVELVGYADRVELDADGRVVVVDLKTGRNAPTGPEVQRDVQLALYQYAVDSGAVDGLLARETGEDSGALPARSGGAELVQLGALDDAVAAVVQPQGVADGEARDTLRDQLSTAAAMLRAESFPAITGRHCETCDFTALCPARSAGAVLDS